MSDAAQGFGAGGLTDAVAHTLAQGGVLATQWPGFKPRQGQTDMAHAVAQTVQTGGRLVVEAGTGVGKTFAYLVPVLLSGQRALVSTATKALQDQLFARDLPRLAAVLGLPTRVALLKGRSSYLCLHRLQQARHAPQAQQVQWQQALARVERWSQVTRSGDMAELPGLDENAALWPAVTSTRENCLGSACPSYKACHVLLARKEAMAADVVVINHHLFFADLMVRESGVAELLPWVRVTVFDEAHQLNEIGVNFLGQELSTTLLLELARDTLGAGLSLARGLCDWQGLHHTLELAVRQWRLAAGERRGSVRLRWTGEVPQGLEPGAWHPALEAVAQALGTLCTALHTVTELAPDFVRLQERSAEALEWAKRFQAPCDEGVVRWAEVSAALRVVQAPLDVADAFGRLTAGPRAPIDAAQQPGSADVDADGAADIAVDANAQANAQADASHAPQAGLLSGPAGAPPRAWIFTSATLGDDAQMRWFTGPCGLHGARTLRVDSPFDYARQAALYVPTHMSAPGSPGHAQDVAELVAQAATRLGGRTLVLTTTLAAMQAIAHALHAHAEHAAQTEHGSAFEVLVQGTSPKRLLMARFREGASAGQSGCVLVASASFWEGFDVPGDALQLVVIDKLPFAPPDDPLYEARGARLQQQGRSVFVDLALPQAAVALKQGAGRLIRSETDQGALVVCDARLTQKGYGLRLLKALPPMRRVSDAAGFEAVLAELASASPKLPPALGG